jgi:hypothetical protein
VGATVGSTLLYLTPPTTMLWVFLMFGDPLTILSERYERDARRQDADAELDADRD